MMRTLVITLLVACGGGQAQRIPVDPPAPVATPPAPVQPAAAPVVPAAPPTLDDKAVIAQSHAWLEASDRLDTEAVVAAMGPTFVLFEDARFIDRELLSKSMNTRRQKNRPLRTRTWSDERVFTAPGTAVFIGHSVETVPATADQKAATQDGYNTVVWVHDGTRWVIAHYQWSRAGVEAERSRWNDAFRQSAGFNKKPNQLLVDTIKGVKPGAALDIAMGQGRNAVYLATQKWKTTGIDISDEGIRQAKEAAAAQKVTFEGLLVDVDTWDLGKNKWDLITLIYAGDDEALAKRIIPALKKGGLFVCEYFHADSEVAKTGAGGWATGELAALFKDGFEILRDDVVDDNADWAGMRKTKLVRFVARKK